MTRTDSTRPLERHVAFETVRRRLFSTPGRPMTIGRFVVTGRLGQGGMGVVYAAYDPQLERRVAVKVMRNLGDPARAQAARRSLEREARAAAALSHPNVVTVYDSGTLGDGVYVAMELVEGTTLRTWLETPRRWPEIVQMFLAAGRGLQAAHEIGLVHCDFKPDNVLVGDDGGVRVADFGIAAALQLDEQADTEVSLPASTALASSTERIERLTRTGWALGTLPYMSPEQLGRGTVDERSDQFGFCVALWEAVTGVRPFAGRTALELLAAVERAPEGLERLPRGLRPVLRRGLAVQPAERFAGMAHVIDALERVRGRGRRRVLTGLAAAGLLASSVGGWALSHATQATPTPCEAHSGRIDDVWSDARQASLAALDPASARYARTTLDRLAGQWRAQAEASCVRGVAPAPDSRTTECATAWLERLDRSLDRIQTTRDPEQVARIPDLLAGLVPPEGDYCALAPDPQVDPEVARTAAMAREAAVLGDDAQAR
ncbi:MAG: serine/threonine protein kinase, partial [Myxococcales bacterium]|nr:serine/threonine protein kinase [Myxococcales bacterium]